MLLSIFKNATVLWRAVHSCAEQLAVEISVLQKFYTVYHFFILPVISKSSQDPTHATLRNFYFVFINIPSTASIAESKSIETWLLPIPPSVK